MSIDARKHNTGYTNELSVSKICMVSDDKKIQMQKGELTHTMKIAQIPNRGLAPAEFSYWRYTHELFGKYMLELCPEIVTCDDGKQAYPLSGPLQIKWCHVWIPHKGHGMWFKSKEEYQQINFELEHEYNEKCQAVLHKVYEMDIHGRWNASTTYLNQSTFKLIGYDDYFKKIEHDINIHKLHAEILSQLGESKSLNYLLYGPPGTGKTTLIRSLAGKYNYSVCVVNPNTLRANTVNFALNPTLNTDSTCKDKLKFVIFEDFDRFIDNTNDNTNQNTHEARNNVMSQILNSLDGFGDNSNVVRFFTGNDYEKISANEALLNRMSGKFPFIYPQKQLFADKLDVFLSAIKPPVVDMDKKNEFLTQISSIEKLTLRPFTAYLVRYIFCEDFMDKLIGNIDELKG